MVLVDYRKAFDMVDHELLLRKLELYGVVNRELPWCHSYLLDRKQVVHVNGSVSSEALMLHGVPQGSILGPLFFILFNSMICPSIQVLSWTFTQTIRLVSFETPFVYQFPSELPTELLSVIIPVKYVIIKSKLS